jgi:hypothetical protein
MDQEEVRDDILEVAIGYAGSIRTSLWTEIAKDHNLNVLLSGWCQAWTTSYQLTPFTALLDLRAPWGWQQREKNESGGVECRRIDKIKSSEYMSEYPTLYT